MASLESRHPRNAVGDLYVDTSCIDCGVCSRLAPGTFSHDDATPNAYVRVQPQTADARLAALRAMVSCPTHSIGTLEPVDVSEAVATLPIQVAPGVYDCGFASEASHGVCAWLLVRPGGNILIDAPRACPAAMDRIEALGGVRTLFLTHRDGGFDDQQAYHDRFGCERVMHVGDAAGPVEHPLDGDGPVELAEGLVAIPVPGHTRGSTALLADDTFLFTGDHVWGDALGRLAASRCLCWWSWPDQISSIRKLRGLSFTWVLPGHGYPFRTDDPAQMRVAVEHLLERMEP